jgi:nuclear receptor subfamily 5 group A protein 3
MLLDMEQHSAALLSLSISPFALLNEATGHGSQSSIGQHLNNNNSSNNNNSNSTNNNNSSSMQVPPQYSYNPSGATNLAQHLNNNNNNTSTINNNTNNSSSLPPSSHTPTSNNSTNQQHQHQQHSSSNHQQSSNNYYMYNFDSQYMFSTGYHGDSGSANNQQNYISLLPTVGNGIASCDQTDLRDLIEEMCPVCGDKVSGYHYGLLTCESCKGFFKRTVQNKKVYTCVAERSCHIDKTQRKRCPYCRFQKCLEVGMKLEAVRADRMRGGRNKFGPMYKRDRARKLQILRQRQLALQAIRGSIGGGSSSSGTAADVGQSQLSPTGYPPYSNMHIKQEIQIPQVSSLTSSPDSSPSPLLGQITTNHNQTPSATVPGNNGASYSSTTTNTTLPNTITDSKLWMANSTTASPHSLSPKNFSFDSGTNPSSTADSANNSSETLRVSPMIREFVQTVDDREWQSSLFSLLQSQTYNQCEVDLSELMCKVLDQNLFSQVDWARNTIFFKDLKVDDQMKLLQNSWSDMLVLDHIHQRLHNSLPDDTTLHNGQKFDLLGLGLLGVPSLAEHFNELQNKLQELKFDVGDYICMKFLLLLNPGNKNVNEEVRGITNRKTVIEGYENVQAALLDYTLTCYPSVTDKFSKLLSIIPEIHAIAVRGEEHLYMKHCAGSAPSQTLLMEMLHAKRK